MHGRGNSRLVAPLDELFGHWFTVRLFAGQALVWEGLDSRLVDGPAHLLAFADFMLSMVATRAKERFHA